MVVGDFFPKTTNSTDSAFLAVVTFFPLSSPAFLFDSCCDSYRDALAARRLPITCVVAIFHVHPAAILHSVLGLLETRIGAYP